jgi:predicted ester cyclase
MRNIIYRAFPDTQFAIDDLIAEGDKVVVRYTYWGTHTGEFIGIAPSGKKLTATAIAIYRIVDGKIKEQWLADRRSTPNIIAQIRSG